MNFERCDILWDASLSHSSWRQKYFCVWVDQLIFYILTTITKWFVLNLYILKFDNKSWVIYYNWELSNWSSIMWKLSKIIFIARWRNSKVLVNLAVYYLCKLKEYWNYFFILPPYLLKSGIGAMQLIYINIWDLFTRWTCLSILKQGKWLGYQDCQWFNWTNPTFLGHFNLYFDVKPIFIRHHEVKQEILRLKETIFTNFTRLNISTKKELGSMKVYELLILWNSKMGSWINNKHYYKSEVQFTSQYHYGTLKVK